ncbi:MAG: fructosamine kinase family protein [Alicyclobacillaceae bacterium]|nr:fructosamine kinase family protein [Alicyclobacillaceae bacterium]
MSRPLPDAVLASLQRVLAREAGDEGPVTQAVPVRGGDIHRAVRIETPKGRYFVKWNDRVPADMFAREAEGLQLLASVKDLSTPKVYGVCQGDSAGCLVLEWIEPASGRRKEEEIGERLAAGLAALHRTLSPAGRYGAEKDNYLGLWPQPGGWDASWAAFFRERRLEPLVAELRRRGRLREPRAALLSKVLDVCDRMLNHSPEPVLLHGDLWSGNWMAAADGRVVFIDPAPWYGDREVDIAFSELFGGFPPSFYRAYRRILPQAPGYEERRPLYQLYFALVHLVLFGESYGPLVDRLAGLALREARL